MHDKQITKNTHSCGFDNITNKSVKHIKYLLLPVLTLIINQMLTTGIHSESLKIAKIKPKNQKKTLRIVTYSPLLSHAEHLFKHTGILKVNGHYLLSILKFCHKLHSYDLPTHFLNYLDVINHTCSRYNLTLINKKKFSILPFKPFKIVRIVLQINYLVILQHIQTMCFLMDMS